MLLVCPPEHVSCLPLPLKYLLMGNGYIIPHHSASAGDPIPVTVDIVIHLVVDCAMFIVPSKKYTADWMI